MFPFCVHDCAYMMCVTKNVDYVTKFHLSKNIKLCQIKSDSKMSGNICPSVHTHVVFNRIIFYATTNLT